MLVETFDAEHGDLGPPRDAELTLGLGLGGQPVTIPTESTLDAPAAHRLVTGHRVLDEPGEQVAVVGQPVREGRPIVEDVLVADVTLDD